MPDWQRYKRKLNKGAGDNATFEFASRQAGSLVATVVLGRVELATHVGEQDVLVEHCDPPYAT